MEENRLSREEIVHRKKKELKESIKRIIGYLHSAEDEMSGLTRGVNDHLLIRSECGGNYYLLSDEIMPLGEMLICVRTDLSDIYQDLDTESDSIVFSADKFESEG